MELTSDYLKLSPSEFDAEEKVLEKKPVTEQESSNMESEVKRLDLADKLSLNFFVGSGIVCLLFIVSLV